MGPRLIKEHSAARGALAGGSSRAERAFCRPFPVLGLGHFVSEIIHDVEPGGRTLFTRRNEEALPDGVTVLLGVLRPTTSPQHACAHAGTRGLEH